MKKLALLLFLFSAFLAQAQILTPAKWSYEASVAEAKVGDEVELIFKATIDKNWYLYSSEFPCEDGPIKTTFNLVPHASYQLVGNLVPVNPLDKYDEIFECDVKIFKKTGEFRQKIKILAAPLVLTGESDYQVCSDLTGQCISSADDFSFAIKVSGASEQIKNDEGAPQQPEGKSLWGFLIVAFLSGLAALFTPCVFPMIPMTVSFFTGRGSRFHALMYGLFIILIYTLVGVALAPLMGPETANHLSTEWIPNLIFFAVFIVFGLSFLGLFEITLPGTLINKVDQQAEKGGLMGVFFMAFTLALVSFSCTGPLVGNLLVVSAGGEVLKPALGMFAFGSAFAIPFTLFAFFPGWLKSLPKSGGWLNTVKVVLGFVEIALAFKFLSIADQAFHWGILDRDLNIAIWIVIALLIGVYLMKGFRMPGDTSKDAEDKTVSVLRISLAMIVFVFTVYLIPGMWGAPLKALAGYLPPLYTHDFNVLSATASSEKPNAICDEPKYADFLHLPHSLNGYFDYDQAIACARQQNKPLFIDFTGHGCTNCREMEANVWSDPKVLQRLRDDYVVVALYVDDKTELPESEWYTSSYDSKVKKTIGKQNADLQITLYKNNAQPFYLLIDKDERKLVAPYGYNLSAEKFAAFLDEGKKKYKELYP